MKHSDLPKNAILHTGAEIISLCKPNDRVTILVPNGRGRNGIEWKEATGSAVICSGDRVALNMGGPHGTPGVATAENVVKSGRRWNRDKIET